MKCSFIVKMLKVVTTVIIISTKIYFWLTFNNSHGTVIYIQLIQQFIMGFIMEAL